MASSYSWRDDACCTSSSSSQYQPEAQPEGLIWDSDSKSEDTYPQCPCPRGPYIPPVPHRLLYDDRTRDEKLARLFQRRRALQIAGRCPQLLMRHRRRRMGLEPFDYRKVWEEEDARFARSNSQDRKCCMEQGVDSSSEDSFTQRKNMKKNQNCDEKKDSSAMSDLSSVPFLCKLLPRWKDSRNRLPRPEPIIEIENSTQANIDKQTPNQGHSPSKNLKRLSSGFKNISSSSSNSPKHSSKYSPSGSNNNNSSSYSFSYSTSGTSTKSGTSQRSSYSFSYSTSGTSTKSEKSQRSSSWSSSSSSSSSSDDTSISNHITKKK